MHLAPESIDNSIQGYCWGGPQEFRLQTSTLSSYTTALPLKNLPQTIRDAITVTLRLGLHYL